MQPLAKLDQTGGVARHPTPRWNARILTEALKMGNVVYLNESEAAKIAETNDASIGRSWEIWKFKALANTPKF